MPILSNLDPWEEIRSGRADQAGADLYWLNHGVQKSDFQLTAQTLKSIIKHKEWQKWRWLGQEFECPSLRECLKRHPPKGVGIKDFELLRRIIYDDKHALDMLDEALRNPIGSNQYPDHTAIDEPLYNVQAHLAPTGNSIEAALRRLRSDDRPIAKQLHAKVLTGELSPHRAAILAGYRKELTAFEQIDRLLSKLSDEELANLYYQLGVTLEKRHYIDNIGFCAEKPC